MAAVRHLLEALLNPFFLTLALFACSLLVLFIYGNRRIARAGLLFSFFFFLLFSTGWLPHLLTSKLEAQYPKVRQVNPETRWVVVLGGGQAQVDAPVNDILYGASIKRLLEGVRLHRQLPNAKLLLSGGEYRDLTPEAVSLGQLSSWFAIPSQQVILEINSMNTAQQAVEIKKWIGPHSFYLVTSAIHMPRAMALCQQQGLNPIAAPTDFTYFWYDERWQKFYLPNPNNVLYLNIAWHEILGRVWARIRGQL